MLTIKELANVLNLSTRTIQRMIENGMPAYKTSIKSNSVYRFELDEVKNWMRNNNK